MPDPYITKAKVYLLGRQAVVQEELARFLNDEGMMFTTDTPVAAEVLNEVAGRVCYMSFGKGRKSNQEYLENILSSKHGSVLEHAIWNVLITGVSRSLTNWCATGRASAIRSFPSVMWMRARRAMWYHRFIRRTRRCAPNGSRPLTASAKPTWTLPTRPRSTFSKSIRRCRRATGASGRDRRHVPSCPTPAKRKSLSPAIHALGGTFSSCGEAFTLTRKSASWRLRFVGCSKRKAPTFFAISS